MYEYESGWFRVTDMGDGTYRVDDGSGTVPSLTFATRAVAELAARELDGAADFGKVRSEYDHQRGLAILDLATAKSRADAYTAAIDAATERFRPLARALTRVCGLDVEPVVDQTGGMVMCLGIYWPDHDAYVWFSDYWWMDGDLVLGLYDSAEDEGTYPDPPSELFDILAKPDEPPLRDAEYIAQAIADWAGPFIVEHGARHGWSPRFQEVTPE